MSQSTCTVKIEIGGVARTGLTVRLSDPTGAYGVKRNDTDAVVVPAGTAMTEIGGGCYAHAFSDPAADLTYTAWVEYDYDGETYRASTVFDGTAADPDAVAPRRWWESIIAYEQRPALHTSRWRLRGLSTARGALNNDDGLLWLRVAVADAVATVTLYKDAACAQSVAAGAADISGADGTAANAAEVVLAPVNGSGLAGSFHIHRCEADQTCAVQAALCVDEDLEALWDGVTELPGYDASRGMAECIRIAGDDVLARVARRFAGALGGCGSAEAWFITDADRGAPDLRRIANPGQLRLACAWRALEIALGRQHHRAGDTMYSAQRDRFAAECERMLDSLTLAVRPSDGANAETLAQTAAHRTTRS